MWTVSSIVTELLGLKSIILIRCGIKLIKIQGRELRSLRSHIRRFTESIGRSSHMIEFEACDPTLIRIGQSASAHLLRLAYTGLIPFMEIPL
jgi:hypothetical protein